MKRPADKYRTIKALVFDYVHRTAGVVDYDALTSEVLRHFPGSRWKRSHWSWYRYQIVKGRFKDLFSPEERRNLDSRRQDAGPEVDQAPPRPPAGHKGLPTQRGPSARDPEVKRLGDDILTRVRSLISAAAGDNPDLRFSINRWVFARLQLEERRVKQPIKQTLWDSGTRTCQACGETFASLKRVELHRKDPAVGYSGHNCELVCRECHEELD